MSAMILPLSGICFGFGEIRWSTFPAYWKDSAIRVEFFGDEIDRIREVNAVTGVSFGI